MTRAKLLVNLVTALDNEKYELQIKVFKLPRSLKFPSGYKVKCVLYEKGTGALRLLLDNHEPFGYHIHSKLPADKNFRELLNFNNYKEAINFFQKEVERILNEK